MKKYLFLFFSLCAACAVVAQVKTVSTNLNGTYELIVQLDGEGFIRLNAYGDILDINMPGAASYYSDFNDYEAEKIKRIGYTSFSYYSNFNDYEAGKIKKIGNTSFSYYSNFNDYEAGKIKRIGNTSFSYYSNFNDYEAGKIKRIGNTSFSYYSNFNDYEAGKVKKIGNNSYTYYTNYEARRMTGQLKLGKKYFEDNGIIFRITPRSN